MKSQTPIKKFDQKTSHAIQGSLKHFNFFNILNIEDNVDFKCGGIVYVFSFFYFNFFYFAYLFKNLGNFFFYIFI